MNFPVVIYIASLVGAVALWLLLPKRRTNYKALGALLAAASVGGIWLFAAGSRRWEILGLTQTAFAYHYVFAALAMIGAVRVITHTRPVYAALWFVMVILASAGMFLVLAAEFMAFAMVIIYGGAILVTYMFVIMLATQSSGEDVDDQPEYDRLAREPIAAAFAGFLLLAVLLQAMFAHDTLTPNREAMMDSDAEVVATILTDRPQLPQMELEAGEPVPVIYPDATGGEQLVSAVTPVEADAQQLANVEHVGLDLFRSHPLGLELAGVILLVALIGAVVIAKTQVPDEDVAAGSTQAPPDRGATVHTAYEPGPKEQQSLGQSEGRLGV